MMFWCAHARARRKPSFSFCLFAVRLTCGPLASPSSLPLLDRAERAHLRLGGGRLCKSERRLKSPKTTKTTTINGVSKQAAAAAQSARKRNARRHRRCAHCVRRVRYETRRQVRRVASRAGRRRSDARRARNNCMRRGPLPSVAGRRWARAGRRRKSRVGERRRRFAGKRRARAPPLAAGRLRARSPAECPMKNDRTILSTDCAHSHRQLWRREPELRRSQRPLRRSAAQLVRRRRRRRPN